MLLIFLLCFQFANSYKILGLFPFPAKSHYLVFDVLMQELAGRGHNVTVYSTFPKSMGITNYRDFDISSCFSLPNRLHIGRLGAQAQDGFTDAYSFLYYLPTHKEVSNCQPLMELVNTSETYDLLITELFHSEFFFLYASKWEIPSIAFHSNAAFTWHCEIAGLPCNPSYVPYVMGKPLTEVSFLRRIEDSALYLYSLWLYRSWRTMYDDAAPKIFGTVPRLEDVAKNISMVFLSSHFTSHIARPMVPNVVEVGGLAIKARKVLPEVGMGFDVMI